jgi:hypothetical protein
VGGMGRSLESGNSVIVSAFHTALIHQFLFLLLIAVVLAIGFNVVRTIQYRRLLVLFGSPGRTPTLAVISPGGSWTRRPAPPSGAVTLAPMSDGSVDAFGVNGSALRVYTLPQRSNTWVRSQLMAVPIAYGPSS